MLSFKERVKYVCKRYTLNAAEGTAQISSDKESLPELYRSIKTLEDLEQYYDMLELEGEEAEREKNETHEN